MQAADHHREKYPNLIFLLFNALFLLVIFWTLPALGNHPARPAAPSRQSALHAGASGQGAEKRMITPAGSLFTRWIMVNFPKLPR